MRKYILETPDGDIWEYDTLDEARRTQYIFGGRIDEIKTPLQVAENKKDKTSLWLMEAEGHLCLVTLDDKKEIIRTEIFLGNNQGRIIVDKDEEGHKRYRVEI